jgi:N-acetyl sugar amidotransferase
MDTTDPNITFDEQGQCDHCKNFYRNILPNWHPNEKGESMLAPVIEKIKWEGKDRDHDCLIGISGGADSSYTAYIAKEKFGLRPLLFHVDAGWNTQVSANNIQRLVEGLGVELYTEVVDWQEMKDLQLTFFKSQVSYIDYPQDLAYFSALYNFAMKNKYKYILTGANYSTECVREPVAWGAYYIDLRFVKDIHRRFGTRPLKTFPLADIFKYKVYYQVFRGQTVVKPLNNTRYIKNEAMEELAERLGWQKYAHKHHESRFTRFYECYWLPKKFGFDKRRAHFSSLILTKQMTRDEALARISKPEIDEETMVQDFKYVAKKLDLTESELQKLFEGENKTYKDYKNRMFLINLGKYALELLGIQKVMIR